MKPLYVAVEKDFETESFDIDTHDYMGNPCTKTIEIRSLVNVHVNVTNDLEWLFNLTDSSGFNYDQRFPQFITELEKTGSYETNTVSINQVEINDD